MMRALAALVFLAALVGCDREMREFRQPTPGTSPAGGTAYSPLHPGEPALPTVSTGQGKPQTGEQGPFEQNAYAIAEGKRLYRAWNCLGCHANGGGDIGPPLMDGKWVYGGTPQDIHDTIVNGRPGGMPSFRGRIPEYQVWQLVAYVRSMSGLVSKDASPGRSDSMNVKKPESAKEKEEPRKQ